MNLSLRINASRIPHVQRAEFVHCITVNFTRNNHLARAKAFAKNPQIIDYIDNYLTFGDERQFVIKVIALDH